MRTAVVAQFEIAARNPDVLRRFYALLFGWCFSAEDREPRNVSAITPASNGVGAISIASADGHSNGLRLIVEVDDLFENLCYADELGGKIVDLPHEITCAGRRVTVASFADPEGNRVGLSNGSQKLTSAPELSAC